MPKIQWYKAMAASWVPGERGANQNLREFLRKPIDDYATARNLPSVKGTSRLSPLRQSNLWRLTAPTLLRPRPCHPRRTPLKE